MNIYIYIIAVILTLLFIWNLKELVIMRGEINRTVTAITI